jgi:hypothetical protein
MFRVVSLFGMVALTVAAAALAKQSQKAGREPRRDNDSDEEATVKIAASPARAYPAFHARFSLN